MSDAPESAAKSARERLEHTRRELLRHMSQAGEARGSRSADDEGGHGSQAGDEDLQGHPTQDTAQHDHSGLGATWQNIRQTASAWWESHPAHLVLEVAEPVFDKYAHAHPMRVLAISAATGAALVLVRPWRLISVTGLLVAAVKSTQMSALAAAMLKPRSSPITQRHEAEQVREEEERAAWQQAQDQARARPQDGRR